MSVRESRFWDKQNEFGLPDSRLGVGRSNTVAYRGEQWEQTYCANCGCKGGMVTAEAFPHVFYLCESCADTHGHLALPEVPAEQVRE